MHVPKQDSGSSVGSRGDQASTGQPKEARHLIHLLWIAVALLVAWMVHTCSNVQSLSGGLAADQMTAVELVFISMLALRPVQEGDQESDEQKAGEKYP